MRSLRLAATLLLALPALLPAQGIPDRTRAAADRLLSAALTDTTGYSRLAELTDTFGHRLSGSSSLESAIDWIIARMQADGFDAVRGEPVMVPHWIRGAESATLVAPRRVPLQILGLGGSVGTPTAGITAPVLVVTSFDDLTARASEAKGKIVLFDVPFAADVAPMLAYRTVQPYRSTGAVAAARVGAVAALVRSLTPQSLATPHTGGTRYDPAVPSIPYAAVSVEDAELLHRLQRRGVVPQITLKMEARTEADAPSRNVVAEIRGSERPDEVVVLGGHIDSWDVGQGAMDDGGGSVAAWQALKLIKELGLKPKRTIRVVLWTNEENGTRGGTAYRDTHKAELAQHVAAIESDNGVFRPYGFRFQGSAAGLALAKQIGALLNRIGAGRVEMGDGEADVGPILREGVPGFALDVDDAKYFWYHHTEADMMTVIDRDELRKCIATMAVMAYVLADLPATLPR
ncbi:MAG: M20/M25/M40 family metallo-hydrolase [Gemmatimonadales bacterium]